MSNRRLLTPEGIPPLVAGLAWLGVATSSGFVGFAFAGFPGCILTGSGVALTLWAGDRRILHYAAGAGFVGVVFALFGVFAYGIGVSLALAVLSAAASVSAGWASLRLEPTAEGVPSAKPGLGLATKVALDEAVMCHLQLSLKLPGFDRINRIEGELREALDLYADEGWLADPLSYHREPPPLTTPGVGRGRVRGADYEHLQFPSEFEPRVGEPGRDRWLGHDPLRTAHAWVMRHPGPPRPWLVCVNGYRMGHPFADFSAFDSRVYFDRLGLNMAIPVLPLHGPRRIGRQSGDYFFDGEFVDTVHAEAQAVWDIRRLLSWIDQQGAPAVGVYGLSLGGYNASLLASVAPGLSCAIAGIPLTDMSAIIWHHGSLLMQRDLERVGLAQEDVRQLLSVVSPLVLAPRLPAEACTIFGGLADRIVPPAQVQALAEHWKVGRMTWYAGGHLSFLFESSVREVIEETLLEPLPRS